MILYKLLKKPFFGRFRVKWESPLAADRQREWQLLHIPSRSGSRLVAWYAEAKREHPKAVIVLGHPMGKEAKGYFIKNGYTDLLLRNGYHVLLFDFNGFGQSPDGNFSYYEDIVAAGHMAANLNRGLPVGYHGISMGGQWAAVAFAGEAHCFDFAIIESASTSLDEFWIHFPVAYNMLKLLNLLLPRFRRKINFGERIKEARGLQSILFVYSENDEWTPAVMGERLHRNCTVPSSLWTVPDARHAAIMKSEYGRAYEQKILEYFNASVREMNKE